MKEGFEPIIEQVGTSVRFTGAYNYTFAIAKLEERARVLYDSAHMAWASDEEGLSNHLLRTRLSILRRIEELKKTLKRRYVTDDLKFVEETNSPETDFAKPAINLVMLKNADPVVDDISTTRFRVLEEIKSLEIRTFARIFMLHQRFGEDFSKQARPCNPRVYHRDPTSEELAEYEAEMTAYRDPNHYRFRPSKSYVELRAKFAAVMAELPECTKETQHRRLVGISTMGFSQHRLHEFLMEDVRRVDNCLGFFEVEHNPYASPKKRTLPKNEHLADTTLDLMYTCSQSWHTDQFFINSPKKWTLPTLPKNEYLATLFNNMKMQNTEQVLPWHAPGDIHFTWKKGEYNAHVLRNTPAARLMTQRACRRKASLLRKGIGFVYEHEISGLEELSMMVNAELDKCNEKLMRGGSDAAIFPPEMPFAVNDKPVNVQDYYLKSTKDADEERVAPNDCRAKFAAVMAELPGVVFGRHLDAAFENTQGPPELMCAGCDTQRLTPTNEKPKLYLVLRLHK